MRKELLIEELKDAYKNKDEFKQILVHTQLLYLCTEDELSKIYTDNNIAAREQ